MILQGGAGPDAPRRFRASFLSGKGSVCPYSTRSLCQIGSPQPPNQKPSAIVVSPPTSIRPVRFKIARIAVSSSDTANVSYRAFSQLPWSGKSAEVWFSLRENHVNVGGSDQRQLRKCSGQPGTYYLRVNSIPDSEIALSSIAIQGRPARDCVLPGFCMLLHLTPVENRW